MTEKEKTLITDCGNQVYHYMKNAYLMRLNEN